MDESTLIKECLKGNSIAQKQLFDMFAPKMMGVCLRYMGTKQEAEDVLQDGFIKVFKKLNAYKNKGSFEGWIRRIVVNTALDQIRKNSRSGFKESIDDVGYKLQLDDFTFEKLAAQDLMQLIQEMPTGYKVIFNLYAIEGYSHKEIGDELNISENTSKSQYSRARAYLRTKLEELEENERR